MATRKSAPKVQPSQSDTASTMQPRRKLDLDNFVPFFVIAIANKMTANSSRIMTKQFKCGVTEWRVLSMLAVEPDISPNRVVEVVGIDKSSVSRAIKGLEARGCVKVLPDPTHGRRQILSLTRQGYGLHDSIIGSVLDREQVLLSGFAQEERDQFIDYLKRLLANMPVVIEFTRSQMRAFGIEPSDDDEEEPGDVEAAGQI